MKVEELILFGEFILLLIIIVLLFLFTLLRYQELDVNNLKKHDILYYDLD